MLNKIRKEPFRLSFSFCRICLVCCCAAGLFACSGESTPSAVTANGSASTNSGLQIKDVLPGQGTAAVVGNRVSVHYTGWLYDPTAADQHGKQFDSSIQRGIPFSFQLGDGQVIKGWDQGVVGMKVGGRRTLIIPHELAYGVNGRGPIPPAASLIFDIELIVIQ
ncbi:FKBP-type peptidyl-prolyl cis-trans isomerase [Undibacterium fentianense]|uniref:Peptidyl-prolyl cis-trans isomerase n=1 Tax=Undibacterium fentianense TaxID=2828728 RepID=A0A941II44_9BURK|nr:FKBP-type peptidyl-prolyl cis-trans isomerase [Undibacterium fentianense]MBR7801585.1 FKBP-type peptidyl-prolyl cis-trans isomerase [Undibacterium fentianense]